MTASAVLFLLIVLACPVMMMVMMRGGHGHGGQGSHTGGCHGGPGHEPASHETSIGGLRRQRADLDRLIEEREAERPESDPELGPSGGSWR